MEIVQRHGARWVVVVTRVILQSPKPLSLSTIAVCCVSAGRYMRCSIFRVCPSVVVHNHTRCLILSNPCGHLADVKTSKEVMATLECYCENKVI